MVSPLSLYRTEAEGTPFVLDVDGGRLVIQRPPIADLLALTEATTQREALDILCGKQATALLAAVGGEDFAVLQAVMTDLRQFFGVGELTRLVWLLVRYGEAIERDLSYFHGVDLLDVFRGEVTPRKVLAYIDRLPSWSAFAEASAQDDEVAEMYAGDEQGESRPRILEWTPERAELVRVVEALEQLTALVHNALGGKSAAPKPHPRPETALERLATRVEDASYEYLLELIEKSQAEG